MRRVNAIASPTAPACGTAPGPTATAHTHAFVGEPRRVSLDGSVIVPPLPIRDKHCIPELRVEIVRLEAFGTTIIKHELLSMSSSSELSRGRIRNQPNHTGAFGR